MAEFHNFDPETHPYALTTADVTLSTRNTIELQLQQVVSDEEKVRLSAIHSAITELRAVMNKRYDERCSYDPDDQRALAMIIGEKDSLIADLQRKYNIRMPMSRTEVDTIPTDGFGTVPFGFSNMLRVSGKRSCETASQMGSWAAYPQGKSEKNIKDFFKYQHSRHPVYQTAVTVRPDHLVRDALYFLQKRPLDHVAVVDDQQRILGILRQDDLKTLAKLDEEVEIERYIPSSSPVTAVEGISLDEAIDIMKTERIHFLPIVSNASKARQELKWVLTREGAERRREARPNLDEKGRLATVIAVSAQRSGWKKRIEQMLSHEPTAIILDSPRFDLGHEEWIERVTYTATLIVQTGRPIRLIVGNIDSPESAASIVAAAVKAGMPAANIIIKAGIGPGHACTTREESGTGTPQWSLIVECAKRVRELGGHVWADGGIRLPGDLVKLLGGGASQGVLGTIAASVVESPALLHQDAMGTYAINFGMASEVFANLREDVDNDLEAMRYRGTFVEGLGEQRVYQNPKTPTLVHLIDRFRNGIRGMAAMSGARTMHDIHTYARFVLQHPSGYAEGLGKTVVK